MKIVCQILQAKNNNVVSITPGSYVYNGLELMVEKNVSSLLVIENDELLGIFTERDYARKVILKGKASRETLISEIMTKELITVTPDTTVDECMRIMTSKFIRHLPVIDHGKLTGVVSIGDLLKHTIEDQKFIIENLEQFITGK